MSKEELANACVSVCLTATVVCVGKVQGNVKRQMSRVGTEQRTSDTAMIETDNGHDQFTARCDGKIQSDRRERQQES